MGIKITMTIIMMIIPSPCSCGRVRGLMGKLKWFLLRDVIIGDVIIGTVTKNMLYVILKCLEFQGFYFEW